MLKLDIGRWGVYISGGGISIKGMAEKGREGMAEKVEAAETAVNFLSFPVELSQVSFTLGDATTLVALSFVAARFYVDMKDRHERKQAEGKM